MYETKNNNLRNDIEVKLNTLEILEDKVRMFLTDDWDYEPTRTLVQEGYDRYLPQLKLVRTYVGSDFDSSWTLAGWLALDQPLLLLAVLHIRKSHVEID